jgi:signal transduction histidine kinase/ActR/RegA family two-component response regulator
LAPTETVPPASSAEAQFEVSTVDTLAKTLQRLELPPPNVILLDLNLPDARGLETLDRVHNAAALIPIVVLTSLENEATAIEAIRLGAQDYLLKSEITPALLARSLRYACERAKVRAELASQKHLFENLVAVARATVERPTLEATLQNAIRVCAAITNAQGGSVLLLDEAGKVIGSVLDHWRNPDALHPIVHKEVMTKGLAGWVAQNRRPALLDDTQQDPRWLAFKDQPFNVRSALAIPVLAQPELLGVILLFHSDVGHFSTENLELMQAASEYMALVIHNARLYDAQQRLIEQLSQAAAATEAAHRTKANFLASASHELRTPLSIILGYNDVLLETLQEEKRDDLLPRVEKIAAAGRQLQAMVNDLLDLSRLEAGTLEVKLETFEVSELVEELAAQARPLAARHSNSLEVMAADNLGTAVTDRAKLERVLMNLLDNAAKFTENGRIELCAHREPTLQGDCLCFEVIDTGIGMAPEQVRRLFSDYTQAETTATRKYGGAGLRLLLSRNLLEMLGGKISVESELGRGSLFSVELPAQAPAANPVHSQA